jgi:thioredoxin 1
MANVAELSDSNFQTEVLQSDQPVLVDFWAPWCAPCRAIAPIIEELATANVGKAKVGKINVDQNNQLAAKYQVDSIPTVMVFKGGEVVDRIVGFGRDLKGRLQNALDGA